MNRPEIDESVRLELLSWGQTADDLEAAARQKRKAGLGCLLIPSLFTLAAILAWLSLLVTNPR